VVDGGIWVVWLGLVGCRDIVEIGEIVVLQNIY
jgi:hypothetical protein